MARPSGSPPAPSPAARAARSSSASSSASRRPFQATRHAAVAKQRRGELRQRRQPPDRSRGDRVVGLAPAGGRPVAAQSSARSQTTRALSIPPRSIAARDELALARRSTRSGRPAASGSAAASTRPGKPAPAPMSAIAPARGERFELEPAEASRRCGHSGAHRPRSRDASSAPHGPRARAARASASDRAGRLPSSSTGPLSRRPAARRRRSARARRPRCRSRLAAAP